jgi:5-formyltetrahydrofolate cyclo-ligase
MTDTQQNADEQMQHALRIYAKRELRKRMQSLRNVLPNSARAERSARACKLVCELPEFAAARTVAGYVAMRKELDVAATLASATQAGKRAVLPRMREEGLTFHVYLPGETLEENDWGVLEPAAAAEQVALADIDLLLVPALALDLRGMRIGYGKSFYDRLLAGARGVSVGVVYDFQLLAEVPNEAHDVPVQRIVSDARSEVAQLSGLSG